MPRQQFIYHPDIEPLKFGYQSGLETLVVHTMNYGHNRFIYLFIYKLTRKCLVWGVKLQR